MKKTKKPLTLLHRNTKITTDINKINNYPSNELNLNIQT